MATAKANLETAKNKVDQAKADFSEVRANLQVADAIRAKAQVMVDYTRLISPYDGVVTRRSFHPGDFVRAPDAGMNVPVFTVSRTDAMRAIIQVPDRDVPLVDRGDPAEVRFDALPGRVFRGKVDRFSNTEEVQNRTMRTEVDLPNPDGALREGMFGLATIVLEGLPGVLTIPGTALVGPFTADQAYCFRVEDGRAVRTPIKLGYSGGGRAIVLEGLKEGDVVAADPARLKDGQAVEVEPEAGDGDGPQQPRPIQ